MAKPEHPPAPTPLPQQGGSYRADPDSGALTRVEHTAERGEPAPAPEPSAPTEE